MNIVDDHSYLLKLGQPSRFLEKLCRAVSDSSTREKFQALQGFDMLSPSALRWTNENIKPICEQLPRGMGEAIYNASHRPAPSDLSTALFFNKDLRLANDSVEGAITLLELTTGEGFKAFDESSRRVSEAMLRVLTKAAEGAFLINPAVVHQYSISLRSYPDGALELNPAWFSGRSLELPAALKLFSVLTGENYPEGIAATGTVESDGRDGRDARIGGVDGVPEKLNLVEREMRHVQRALVPHENAEVIESYDYLFDIEPVENLEQALSVAYGDYKTKLTNLQGRCDVEFNEVSSNKGKGMKVTFNFSGNLDPAVLRQFDTFKLANKINEKAANGDFVVLDNFIIGWLIGAVSAQLKNNVNFAVATVGSRNDQKRAVVILGGNGFKVGDIIEIHSA